MIPKDINDVDLTLEIAYSLALLARLRNWTPEQIHENNVIGVRLISLVESIERPVSSITELYDYERECLVDLLLEMDIDVDEVLNTLQLFQTLSNFLDPTSAKTLNLSAHHLSILHLQSLPFLSNH